MWLSRLVRYKMRGVPLWVFACCGLAGVLVDLDHAIAYWFTGHGSRAAHLPLAVVSGIVLGGGGACIGRSLFKMVLKRKKVVSKKGLAEKT